MNSRRYIYKLIVFLGGFGCFLASCSENTFDTKEVDKYPFIWPDYKDITIPCNIAPLNFALKEEHSDAYVLLQGRKLSVRVKERNSQFSISENQWRKLLEDVKGDSIKVTIALLNNEEWFSYKPFCMKVAQDSIDPYLAYRLIEPGYELWNEMGIYQRNLESYEEEAIYENKLTKQNCVNCHSFCMQDPEKMLFHMRADFACTILVDGDKLEKLNTKTDKTISSLVYPSWHPSGKYVAFSVNTTKQAFHTNNENRIEVFDQESDVVVYDVEKHEIITCASLFSKERFETFPTFSPDGKTLYFCTANAYPMPEYYKEVKYNLCSIEFNPEDRSFGRTIDTVYNARKEGKSVSFPRVSPDGRYLLYTLSGYGNFSIWHKDADLCMMDLKGRELKDMSIINSQDVESYHSWSSNSRWFVFSSRRIDSLYTRLYIGYIDKDGRLHTPFLLPQKDVSLYHRLMKSYNVPELIKGKVSQSKYKIALKAKKDPGIQIKSAF
ncbi:TolB family protein [Parabacteroides pacaensis]|uniref:TolB family protein n=1 Tax=Parabacteroides pacaensis TaxID=2086575 RepID=UPI000D0F7365|nr:PD40 domain-containing protein [Parabacteroides pacaensis]